MLHGAFTDHHVHVLAAAAARRSVDLRGAGALAEVLERIRAAAVALDEQGAAPQVWLRAWGVDESELSERRLPGVDELDRVSGARPTVVHHRTGHVELRNRAAHQAGAAPRLAAAELRAAAAELAAAWSAAGIVAVTDATHTNDRHALETLDRLGLPQRITAMVGAEVIAAGSIAAGSVAAGSAGVGVGGSPRGDGGSSPLAPGDVVGSVRVGAAKIMPPHCGLDGIADLVAGARRAGFPVAVHAVDVDELQAAIDAGLQPGDRIEHLGLSLAEQVTALAEAGVTVVTQPSFVTRRAAKYRQQLSEVEQGWLYRLRSLLDAGVAVLGSSDAPVVPARPLESVAAAIGRELGPSERIDVDSALGLASSPLSVGSTADLVVLAADPRRVAAAGGDVGSIEVLATWNAGRLIHGSPTRWPGRP